MYVDNGCYGAALKIEYNFLHYNYVSEQSHYQVRTTRAYAHRPSQCSPFRKFYQHHVVDNIYVTMI